MKLILTLAYLSMFGESKMETYDYSAHGMTECRRVAAEWKGNIKANRGRIRPRRIYRKPNFGDVKALYRVFGLMW